MNNKIFQALVLRKLIPILLILFLVIQIGRKFLVKNQKVNTTGTIYYIDNTVPDIHMASATPDCTNYNLTTYTCSGGATQAYATIADINLKSFMAGDSILFRKGQKWREQLTVSSSGVKGFPITFGAYGNGELPIISGSDPITQWAHTKVANVYVVPLVIEPYQVFNYGIRIPKGSSQSSLSQREWFWSNGKLYLYNDSGNPQDAKSIITASTRNYNIELDAKNYITIQNLNLTNSNLHNLYIRDSLGFLVTGVTATNGVSSGIQIDESKSSVAGTVSSSNFTGNGTDIGEAISGIKAAIDIRYVKSGVIIEHNNIGSASNPNFHGFEFDQNSSGNILRYNDIHDNYDFGVQIDNSNYNEIYYNLIRENGIKTGNAGMVIYNIQQGTVAGTLVYNNVFYQNGSGGINIRDEQTNLKIKNNIFIRNNISQDEQKEIMLEGGYIYSGLDIDYNDYYHDSSSQYWNSHSFRINGKALTFDEWKTVTGQDAHSLNVKPLFASSITPDFHLRSASSLIDAGTNVGLTSDYAGGSVPKGSAPEIGVYEFR